MNIITKQQLQKHLENPDNFFLLDVRSQEEYEAGHVPTAILAPWETVTERVRGLKPDTPLVLYCRTQTRAQKAATILKDAGYNNVSVYAGGYEDWTH